MSILSRPKVHDANSIVQFCTSYGKYFTSIEHELLNIDIDNHVILPMCVMMTLELTDVTVELTSALKDKIITKVIIKNLFAKDIFKHEHAYSI